LATTQGLTPTRPPQATASGRKPGISARPRKKRSRPGRCPRSRVGWAPLMPRRSVLAAVGLVTLLVANVAAAAPQPADPEPQPPKGTVGKDPATSGSTEIEGQGAFAQVGEREEAAGDALEWDLSFGALFSTGNA